LQQQEATSQPRAEDTTCSALKIVHAGVRVECYYMAMPAIRILEKYPSFVLARPEAFRQPDSVLYDQILTLREMFFVNPRQTIKKLRRRIRKPKGEVTNSFVSKSS
ncbi:LOW QUALITY PROTEIN: hypothetical protein CFOL_v3_11948, partial [Cephalotus follicularis]